MEKMTLERKRFILSQLNAIGLTYQDIGKALDVSRQRVEQLINTKFLSLFAYTPKRVKNHNIIVLLLRMQNKSVKKLAEEIGISINTLYNKLYRNQDGSVLRRKRYFTVGQAESVAKYFGEKIDVLFDKVDVLPYKRGIKPYGKSKPI